MLLRSVLRSVLRPVQRSVLHPLYEFPMSPEVHVQTHRRASCPGSAVLRTVLRSVLQYGK